MIEQIGIVQFVEESKGKNHWIITINADTRTSLVWNNSGRCGGKNTCTPTHTRPNSMPSCV